MTEKTTQASGGAGEAMGAALGWSHCELLDSLPICVTCKDAQGRITYANQTFGHMLQRRPEELLGLRDVDLFPAELAQKYRADDLRVMETGQPFECVEENRADGSQRFYEVRKTALRDPQGKAVGIQAVFWDVTARKLAEDALEHEQYLLHALMDNLPDSIYFKDRDRRFMRVSKGQAIKFGIDSPDDAVGKTDAEIYCGEHAESARRDEEEIMRSGRPILGKLEKETWEHGVVTYCSSTKLPLRDRQGQIVGTFGISRDVTDLVKAEAALRRAKEEADTANRAKSDFLANMSHEIRTPLNAIIGMTELLLDTDPTPTQQEYLSMVLASGESLLSIINDILDFSKIEAGKFDLDAVVFDLHNCLGDTIKSLGLRAHEKNLELAFFVAPDVPQFVEADLVRLRQVIINLVGNAIKFTERGEVVLSVECAALQDRDVVLSFSVRDTGIGIPFHKIDRIFQEFEQADSSTTRNFGGTGLGLAISSRLVGLMGGKLTVDSQPGVGSTFRFTARVALPGHGSERHQAETSAMRGSRILVVDDNATNRRIMQEMLQNWGLRPVLAERAEDALEQLMQAYEEGHPIPLVLTDVNMPRMDGFMLTEAIRRDPRLGQTGIILLTSGSRLGDADRCRELRVAARLTKPVKQSEVLDAIVNALDGVPQEDEAREDAERFVPPPARRLHVLLAEDNRVNQRLAVGLLEKQGHQVTVANHGEEAVSLWERGQFDLILMDVQMPLLDGYQATRKIRGLEQEQDRGHTPIIAMTARAMKGDRERCVEAGMDDYLAKPIRLQQLADKLQSLGQAPPAAVPEAPGGAEEDASPAAFDWQAALRSVRGDRQLLQEVVQAFLEEGPTLLALLRQAVDDADATAIHRWAHALKGSALFLQTRAILRPAEQLERLGHQEDLTGVDDLLRQLETGFQQVCQHLSEGVP